MTDNQIKSALQRLIRGDFAESDLELWYDIVRNVVRHHNLPASQYGPSSRFGGTAWTDDDIQELTHDWLIWVKDARAEKLASQERSARHVAASTRLSIYRHILDQRAASPMADLWHALREAIRDFPDLLATHSTDRPGFEPQRPFPWRRREATSARRRAVTTDEIRQALQLVVAQAPSGWSMRQLAEALARWANITGSIDVSLEKVGAEQGYTTESDAAAVGRELAYAVWGQLEDDERTLLTEYVMPRAAGEITLERASQRLQVPVSTLHDRARRLVEKLNNTGTHDGPVLDKHASKAFVEQIFLLSAGKPDSGDCT